MARMFQCTAMSMAMAEMPIREKDKKRGTRRDATVAKQDETTCPTMVSGTVTATTDGTMATLAIENDTKAVRGECLITITGTAA